MIKHINTYIYAYIYYILELWTRYHHNKQKIMKVSNLIFFQHRGIHFANVFACHLQNIFLHFHKELLRKILS